MILIFYRVFGSVIYSYDNHAMSRNKLLARSMKADIYIVFKQLSVSIRFSCVTFQLLWMIGGRGHESKLHKSKPIRANSIAPLVKTHSNQQQLLDP